MRLTRLNQLFRDGREVHGTWRLTKNHEVEYRRRGAEEEVVLRGDLVAVEENRLLFQLSEEFSSGESVRRRFALRGRWLVDASNRLSFEAERQKGRPDWLTLQGAWEVGPGHQILYRFHRENLKTRKQDERILRFSGRWEIDPEKRLTYVLDRVSGSAFRFRGTFESAPIQAKTGEIRYQLGLEANGESQSRTVTLFGKWKFSRRLALSFEVPYPGRALRSLSFGADYSVDSRQNVTARLTTREGKPLGLEVIFTRQIFKGDGEGFLRLVRSSEESAVQGGFRFRW